MLGYVTADLAHVEIVPGADGSGEFITAMALAPSIPSTVIPK